MTGLSLLHRDHSRIREGREPANDLFVGGTVPDLVDVEGGREGASIPEGIGKERVRSAGDQAGGSGCGNGVRGWRDAAAVLRERARLSWALSLALDEVLGGTPVGTAQVEALEGIVTRALGGPAPSNAPAVAVPARVGDAGLAWRRLQGTDLTGRSWPVVWFASAGSGAKWATLALGRVGAHLTWHLTRCFCSTSRTFHRHHPTSLAPLGPRGVKAAQRALALGLDALRPKRDPVRGGADDDGQRTTNMRHRR